MGVIMSTSNISSTKEHAKPLVYETLTSKSMFFSIRDVQSKMHLLHPYELQFEYTKIMMGFLLHKPKPLSIAMVGLGGGSLAKFCYRYLGQTDITVIEINPHVIALRDDFSLPIDNHRFAIHLGDAAAFFAETEERFDVVLADGFDIDGIPAELSSQQFYADCYKVLNPGGMLVANLHACTPLFDVVLDRIRSAFQGSLLTVNDPSASNRLTFSVKDQPKALFALSGMRRPQGFDEGAWKELTPSMGRVFLASRDLERASRAII